MTLEHCSKRSEARFLLIAGSRVTFSTELFNGLVVEVAETRFSAINDQFWYQVWKAEALLSIEAFALSPRCEPETSRIRSCCRKEEMIESTM
jgi:hypothetical protein